MKVGLILALVATVSHTATAECDHHWFHYYDDSCLYISQDPIEKAKISSRCKELNTDSRPYLIDKNRENGMFMALMNYKLVYPSVDGFCQRANFQASHGSDVHPEPWGLYSVPCPEKVGYACIAKREDWDTDYPDHGADEPDYGTGEPIPDWGWDEPIPDYDLDRDMGEYEYDSPYYTVYSFRAVIWGIIGGVTILGVLITIVICVVCCRRTNRQPGRVLSVPPAATNPTYGVPGNSAMPAVQPPVQPIAPPPYAYAMAPPPPYQGPQGKQDPPFASSTPIQPPPAVPTNQQHPPAKAAQNPQPLSAAALPGFDQPPSGCALPRDQPPFPAVPTNQPPPSDCGRSVVAPSEHLYMEIAN